MLGAENKKGSKPVEGAAYWLLLIAATTTLFAAILAFGGARGSAGLILATTATTGVAAILAFSPRSRSSLRLDGPIMAAVLFFLATLLWVGLPQMMTFQQIQAAVPALAGSLRPSPLATAPGSAVIDRYAAQVETLKLYGLGAMFLAGLVLGAGHRRSRRTLLVLTVAGAVYTLWAFFDHLTHPGSILGLTKSYHQGRLTGSFFSANNAADVFGVFACLALALMLDATRLAASRGGRGWTVWERIVRHATPFLVMLVLFGGAAVMTASRGGLLATLLACLLIVACWCVTHLSVGGPDRIRPGVVLSVLAGVIVTGVVLFVSAGSRLLARSADGSKISQHGDIIALYWRKAWHAPTFGHGLGSFRAFNGYEVTAGNFKSFWDLGALHNVYLQWAMEAGVVGAVLISLSVACVLLAILTKPSRRRGPFEAAAVLGISVLLLAHNAVDYSLQIPAIALLWALLLGVAAGADAAPKRLRA